MVRIWSLAALAVGIWLIAAYLPSRPVPGGFDAPATRFSAARADAMLGRVQGDQAPHPSGSAAAVAVRGRILKELAAMGVAARTWTGMSCYGEARWRAVSCGTVTNIIADVLPGTGKQILLMAHSDSVAAGPGAGDDGAGVAVMLETIRALKARGGAGHPVTALFSDGEEPGLLGAAAYLRDAKARANIGVVVNADVRGNRGRSFLFQTSAGNSKLMQIYAAQAPDYAASSIGGEIYKYLPNDTDLTPALAAGLPGVNFAFFDNVAAYHTPLDRRENLDPRSLQQQGDGVLAMADALRRTEISPPGGGDAIYLDILGRWLPRLDARWALPLSIAAFAVIALAGVLTGRRRHALPPPLPAALFAPPLLVLGALGVGFVLHGLAAWISGEPDPSFAHPLALRLALGLGVFGAALITARGASAIACWLWLAALGTAAALFAPGATPYFLFPALVAAPLLLVTARASRSAALLGAALVSMLMWFGLAVTGEGLMGLKFHPMFTVTTALGLVALLPLLRIEQGWRLASLGALMAALGLAVVAGLTPAYSPASPQRLNLSYAQDGAKASWIATPVARLPASLRAAAAFGDDPVPGVEYGYAAPAGTPLFAPPSAAVSRDGAWVTLRLQGSAAADGMRLIIPRAAAVSGLTIGAQAFDMPDGMRGVECVTPDCRDAVIGLRMVGPANLTLIEIRRGLPPGGAKLVQARPASAVPSSGGDQTLLAAQITVPGR